MEQLIMIDALKRGSAKRITAILPFYPYARQDKKHRGREPISARLVADLLKTAGADRILTVDLHTDQIQGFFDGPVDHMRAQNLLTGYIAENYPDHDMVVVSPDSGRVRVAEKWADSLGGVPLAFIHKTRDPLVPNQVKSNRVVGDVRGKTCILTDDMIDTGGTIAGAVKLLHEDGAKDVIIAATHGVLSDPAPAAAGRLRRPRGDRHQHAADRRGKAVPAADGAVDRAAAGQHHPRGVRQRLGHRTFRRVGLAWPVRPSSTTTPSARPPARRWICCGTTVSSRRSIQYLKTPPSRAELVDDDRRRRDRRAHRGAQARTALRRARTSPTPTTTNCSTPWPNIRSSSSGRSSSPPRAPGWPGRIDSVREIL